MKITPTDLPGVMLIEPTVFSDARGFFMESYHVQRYVEAGLPGAFVQDNYSRSRRGVLRGLHYQLHHSQGKLVWVTRGEVFDVVVDIRQGSPTFGRWLGVVLAEDNPRQLYVPPGFAHGFCTLSDTADFLYKCNDFYHPDDESGILWCDPDLAISWPVFAPILSPKDQRYPRLAEVPLVRLPIYESA
jgi:dTDP-4-dehydrorhamnose 3,5-epimerase